VSVTPALGQRRLGPICRWGPVRTGLRLRFSVRLTSKISGDRPGKKDGLGAGPAEPNLDRLVASQNRSHESMPAVVEMRLVQLRPPVWAAVTEQNRSFIVILRVIEEEFYPSKVVAAFVTLLVKLPSGNRHRQRFWSNRAQRELRADSR
jgi:hypothetical protein